MVDNPTAEAHPAAPFARLRGRVTGTKVRVLGEEGGAPAANVLTGSAYDAAPPEPDTVYFKPEGGRVTLLPGFTSRPGQVLFIGANIDVPDHLEAGTGGGLFLASARYYDRRGRVIQTQAQNRLGGTETATTLYDFAGRVVKAKHTHTAPSPYERTLTVRTRSAYDEGGRLARTWQRNDGEAEVQVAEYGYDALGRTEQKRLHVEGGAAAQQTLYQYHERGWLRSMLTPGLFSLYLYYDQLPPQKTHLSGTARYDGSISVQTWQQTHLEWYNHAYAYAYDDLGRVEAAQRYDMSGLDFYEARDAFTLEAASYDLHGNLKQVRRRGQSGAVIDDLAYGYGAGGASGNQLTSVSDAAPSTDGHDFADGSGTCAGGAEYAYDPNGNLECDGDRGIEIRYNYLNLPEEVTWSDGRRIAWTYDATGSKLRKQVYDATGSLTLGVDYAGGGVVYEQQAGESAPDLAYFPMAEGRVVADASAGSGSSDYAYEYQVHDHLGSLRAAFRPDAPTAAVQWADYYPYGLRMAGRYGTSGGQENKALYNGKELEDDHDLGWYHYGVRYYDVRLARWHAMDPADEFHSPYVYVGGDPVNFVDPDGAISVPLDEFQFDQNGNFLRRIERPGEHFISVAQADGSWKRFEFNDQADALRVGPGGDFDQIDILTRAEARGYLKEGGARPSNFLRRTAYAIIESQYNGRMDYRQYVQSDFVAIDGVAYNYEDFGNFLWGGGMRDLGFSAGHSSIGANVYTLLNGRRTYDDGKFLQYDSAADQRAITNGYYFFKGRPEYTRKTSSEHYKSMGRWGGRNY